MRHVGQALAAVRKTRRFVRRKRTSRGTPPDAGTVYNLSRSRATSRGLLNSTDLPSDVQPPAVSAPGCQLSRRGWRTNHVASVAGGEIEFFNRVSTAISALQRRRGCCQVKRKPRRIVSEAGRSPNRRRRICAPCVSEVTLSKAQKRRLMGLLDSTVNTFHSATWRT